MRLLGPLGFFLVMSAAGLSLIVWLREKLVALVSTRVRRFAIEAVGLFALQAVSAILMTSPEVQALVSPPQQTAVIAAAWVVWALAATLSLQLVVQAFVVAHADHAEIQKRTLENERDDARQERLFYMVVSDVFMSVVSKKREFLRDAHPDAVFTELPQKQTAALISACWEIINGMVHAKPSGRLFRVRVAYFRATSEGLKLELSWNGKNGDCVSLEPSTVAECFLWNGSRGCLARLASRQGSILQVANADEADRKTDHPFHFFSRTERSDLKSIVALPIKFEGAPAPHDVLVIDTDREGFFDPADENLELKLRHIGCNLAHRLQVERGLQFLGNRGPDVGSTPKT